MTNQAIDQLKLIPNSVGLAKFHRSAKKFPDPPDETFYRYATIRFRALDRLIIGPALIHTIFTPYLVYYSKLQYLRSEVEFYFLICPI